MKSTILTIACALVAGVALAAPDEKGDKAEKGKGKGKGDPAARAEKMMEKLDKDGDGKISKTEFAESPMGKKAAEKGGQEGVDKIFGRMDANSDGSVTKDELGRRGGKGKGKGDKKKPDAS